MWAVGSWQQFAVLQLHSLTVTQLAFSHDSTLLLATSRDRTWSLWQRSEGDQGGKNLRHVCNVVSYNVSYSFHHALMSCDLNKVFVVSCDCHVTTGDTGLMVRTDMEVRSMYVHQKVRWYFLSRDGAGSLVVSYLPVYASRISCLVLL